jgi:hypothetical protein
MNHLCKIKRSAGWLLACAAVMLTGCGQGTPDQTATEDRIFKGASRHECATGESDGLQELTVNQVLDEANRKFTYRGKPIHPKLAQEFQCWTSDLNPVTVAVDVSAAFDTNEYSDDVDVADGRVSFTNEEGLYAYRRSGFKKREWAHVLETTSGGSGTYVEKTTLWVRFEIGQSFYPDGKPYDQLILRLVRAF